jgi:hypothetical protein
MNYDIINIHFKITNKDLLEFNLKNFYPENFVSIDKNLNISYYYDYDSVILKKNLKDFHRSYQCEIIKELEVLIKRITNN